MNFTKKIVGTMALAGSIFAAVSANAGIITFDSNAVSVNVGDTFQINLVGRDWIDGEDGTYGGGVSVSWDSSILSMLSYDTSVFAGDQFLAGSTTASVDNVNGKLSNVSVNSLFTGVYEPDFNIATLTFSALALGETDLIASLGLFESGFANIWTDSADGVNAIQVDPQFLGGHVTSVSAVPLPGSALLFGSALLGLAGFVRRKSA